MNANDNNNENDNKITAQRLRDAMYEANLKPSELSRLSGVSKSSISQYLKGTCIPSNLSAQAMGNILDVNPLWLMGFSEEYLPRDGNGLTTRVLSYVENFEKAKLINEINILARKCSLDDLKMIIDMLKRFAE